MSEERRVLLTALFDEFVEATHYLFARIEAAIRDESAEMK